MGFLFLCFPVLPLPRPFYYLSIGLRTPLPPRLSTWVYSRQTSDGTCTCTLPARRLPVFNRAERRHVGDEIPQIGVAELLLVNRAHPLGSLPDPPAHVGGREATIAE